jgi:hypothetical protein
VASAPPMTRRARLEPLLEAARVIAEPGSQAGRALRARLLETTGLSRPNIELGLTRCLEWRATDAELSRLLATTPEAPHAHVLLSANVFVAAFRAIAIGVASSPRVSVRASRRDPALAQALNELLPGSFELVSELLPEAGEHVWAYGSDATLAQVRARLPSGVWFHEHGSGMGAVVLEGARASETDLASIALDAALFDQQGCLSPRLVCVAGASERARAFAEALAEELSALAHSLPAGAPTPDALAEARRQRDTAAYAFELFDAGSGWVSFGAECVVPPPGRQLHVFAASDPVAALLPYARHLTCIGTNGGAALLQRLARALPGARLAALGDMQRPPLDGPVDLRHGSAGSLVP